MFNSYQQNTHGKPYYITTAIDYPNAPPHVGHSLEKVAADAIARYHRLQGHDTYFSMGLDENSHHAVQAARPNIDDIVTCTGKQDQSFRLLRSTLAVW